MNTFIAIILLCITAFSQAATVHRDLRRATTDCSNTPIPNVCMLNQAGVIHLPYPSDDAKFILCHGGRMYVVICPIGETYNKDKQDCGLTPTTKPANPTPTTQPANPTPTTQPANPGTKSAIATVTDRPKMLATTRSLNPCDLRTLTMGNMYFPHPSDNTKFIQCDFSGHAFVKQCPEKLIWNKFVRNCVESLIG